MTDTEKHPLVERLRNALTEIDHLRRERDSLQTQLVLTKEKLQSLKSRIKDLVDTFAELRIHVDE